MAYTITTFTPRNAYPPPIKMSGKTLGRWIASATAIAVVAGLTVLGSPTSYADSPVLDGEIMLDSAPSQRSGLEFSYILQLSCSELTGSDICNDVKIRIPIPAALGVSGATDPADWAYRVVGVPTGPNPVGANVTITPDGLFWEITLDRTLNAGESPRLTFHVTPPAGTTPDQTVWTLTGTITGTDSTGGPLLGDLGTAASATATAEPVCAITPSADFGAVPLDTDRTFTFSFNTGLSSAGYSVGALAVDPTAVPSPTVTISLPSQYLFVNVTDSSNTPYPYTLNGLGEYVFDLPGHGTASGVPTDSGISFTLTSPTTPVTATAAKATATLQYSAIGEAGPTICSANPGLPATGGGGLSGFWSKSAIGWTRGGLADQTPGVTTGMDPSKLGYARTDRDPEDPLERTFANGPTLPAAQWYFSFTGQNSTLTKFRIYDGMPCLSNGTGTMSDPYTSLPEGQLCTEPAFRVLLFHASSFQADLSYTAYYTDGSQEEIPTTQGSRDNWYVPEGKMVAAVSIEGDYTGNPNQFTILFRVYGYPVASLPATTVSYLRNFATMTPQPGSNITSGSSVLWVGMQTVPDYAVLKNQVRTSTHEYAPGWSGTQSFDGIDASTNVDDLYAQRRIAVVFPAGSGIKLIGLDATSVGTSLPLPVSETPNYDAQGSSRFMIDISQAPNLSHIASLNVSYGDMLPGVYTY